MVDERVDVFRYRWVILGLTWMAFVAVYLVKTAVAALSPFMVDSLHLSRFEIGLLVSAVAFGHTVIQMPAGWLVDRFGTKKVLFAGPFVGGVLVLGMLFVDNFVGAMIILTISGFGCGCFPTVAIKALFEWFPMRERATVTGVNQTAMNFGGMMTAATLPITAAIMGWRIGFVAVGVTSIIAAVVAYTFYRDPQSATDGLKTVQRGIFPSWRMMREVIFDRKILMVSFSCLGLAIAEFTFTGYLIIYLKEAVRLSVAIAGGYLALANLGGIFGKPFFGAMSDRLFAGSRKQPLLLVGVLISMFTIAMQIITASTPHWILIALFFFFGFTAIGWGGMNLVLVSELADRKNMGLAVGYSVMIVLTGSIVGPPIFGWMADVTGSYSLGWWFLTASAVASIFILLPLQERKKVEHVRASTGSAWR